MQSQLPRLPLRSPRYLPSQWWVPAGGLQEDLGLWNGVGRLGASAAHRLGATAAFLPLQSWSFCVKSAPGPGSSPSSFCSLCTSSCAWEILSWSLVSWSFLSTLCHVQGFVGGNSKKTKHVFNGLCYQLQVYLGRGLDMCSWKVLSQVLFTKTHRERQAERVS